jgi:hypothetical protein
MADLSSLMQIAPNSAAFMMGQNNSQAMQSEALKQQQLQQIIQGLIQEQQQNQQMNPLKVDQQRLQNQGLEAELPGKRAHSESQGLDAQLKRLTQPGEVEATNAGNAAKVTKADAEKMTQIGQLFGRMGVALENEPDQPGARAGKMMQMLQQSGFPANDPRWKPLLDTFQAVPSAQLPKALQATSEKWLKQTEGYQQAMDVENVKRTSAEKIATDHNKTLTNIQQMQIDAGKYDKKQVATDFKSQVDASLLKAAGNPEGQLAILNRAQVIATQQGLPALAANFGDQAASIEKLVKAKIGAGAAAKPDIGTTTGGRVPNMPAPDITPPARAALAPASQPQVKSIMDLQKMYPGVPAAKLQELYKKKFGVDLQ